MRSKKKLIQSEKNLSYLSNKLNSLCKFLDELYDINSGGCCFISFCIANLLEQDNILYDIGIIDDYPENTLEEFDHSAYHVFLIVNDDYNINNESCDEYTTYPGSSLSLIQYYNKVSGWNSIYDHSKNVYMKKLITNFYYDFTEDLRER